jgi:hypothetical protein
LEVSLIETGSSSEFILHELLFNGIPGHIRRKRFLQSCPRVTFVLGARICVEGVGFSNDLLKLLSSIATNFRFFGSITIP